MRNRSGVMQLRSLAGSLTCTIALARIAGYSEQERLHKSAAPLIGYNSEVMIMYSYTPFDRLR
jgi:hypothetical protein